MRKSYFICQKWLAVEKDDGVVERLLPVASESGKHELFYLLSKKAYRNLSDGHLWFSIFSRPPPSSFTRVQRCTCSFVLLFTAMLLNILYYGQQTTASSESKSDGLSFGPFYFTREQISIGLIIDVLIFIPSTLLVEFYRRIRRRQHSPPTQRSSPRAASNKTQCSMLFLWWCVFIAYGLSFSLMIPAVFLIIARGIELGDVKTQKWLTSLASSFFSSVLLSQPVKVLCIAVFFSLLSRKRDQDEEAAGFIDENEGFDLNGDNEQLRSLQGKTFATERHCTQVNRLNKPQVAEAREIRLRQSRMWSSLRELVTYVSFLTVLFLLSGLHRNTDSHQQVRHLRNYFLNPHRSIVHYAQISTIDELWNWLQMSLLPNVRTQPWYNGESAWAHTGFLNDRANRVIGWPLMRQWRVQSNVSCRVPTPPLQLIPSCEGDYSQSNEQRHLWAPGWMSATNLSYSSSIRDAFTYRSSEELGSPHAYAGEHGTYGGGGYTYQLSGRLADVKENLTLLRQLAWIDQRTRAVLIQLSLYNPNTELYTSVTFLAEFLPTSGVFPLARFEPIDLNDRFLGFSSLFHALCALAYLLFTVYFTVMEIRSLISMKNSYFRSVRPLLGWGILGCSWAAVGIAVWRWNETSRLVSLFRQTHSYQYVNLQSAVYIEDVFSQLLGLCCFFAILKVAHRCQFNARLSQMSKTFRYASKDLLYLIVVFSIVFFSFDVLFYLLFSSRVRSCSTILSTTVMLCHILVRKLRPMDYHGIEVFLGPYAVAVVLYSMVFVFYLMFLVTMIRAFRCVRRDSVQVA